MIYIPSAVALFRSAELLSEVTGSTGLPEELALLSSWIVEGEVVAVINGPLLRGRCTCPKLFARVKV